MTRHAGPKVSSIISHGKAVFGEGLTIFADRIFQLTWKNKLLFEYEVDTFEPRPREIAIDGWGLTNDGRRLIASDGSDTLYFLNPDTLATLGTMKVKRKAWGLLRSQAMVNEMEMVGQKILGNIYRSNEIVQIDLETGCVDGVADFSRLYDELDTEQKHQVDSHSNNVLNGIAYSKKRGTFFLTGKRWPIIFEVRMDISPPAPTDQSQRWAGSSAEARTFPGGDGTRPAPSVAGHRDRPVVTAGLGKSGRSGADHTSAGPLCSGGLPM